MPDSPKPPRSPSGKISKPSKETPRSNHSPEWDNLETEWQQHHESQNLNYSKLACEPSLPKYAAAGHREPAAAVHAARHTKAKGFARSSSLKCRLRVPLDDHHHHHHDDVNAEMSGVVFGFGLRIWAWLLS